MRLGVTRTNIFAFGWELEKSVSHAWGGRYVVDSSRILADDPGYPGIVKGLS